MLQEDLQKIYDYISDLENLMKSELKQVTQEDQDDGNLRADLLEEIQRLEKARALEKMQQLQTIDKQIELRRRTDRIIQKGLEQLEKIKTELQQLEFRNRITLAEFEASSLRKRREEILQDQIPDIEKHMNALLNERREIDSRLLNLNEEISLLRRRVQNVPQKP